MKATTKKKMTRPARAAKPSRTPVKAKALKTPKRPAPVKQRPATSLGSKHMEAFRALLVDRRVRLTEAYNKNKTYGRQTDDEGSQDLADKASSTYTKEFLYSLSNTDREILQKVDEALLRIEQGEYGLCVECGDEINRRRLEAVPWASHCIVCQEKVEKGLL